MSIVNELREAQRQFGGAHGERYEQAADEIVRLRADSEHQGKFIRELGDSMARMDDQIRAARDTLKLVAADHLASLNAPLARTIQQTIEKLEGRALEQGAPDVIVQCGACSWSGKQSELVTADGGKQCPHCAQHFESWPRS